MEQFVYSAVAGEVEPVYLNVQQTQIEQGVGVGVGVLVCVTVGVGVGVLLSVKVGVGVSVGVEVEVTVGVGVIGIIGLPQSSLSQQGVDEHPNENEYPLSVYGNVVPVYPTSSTYTTIWLILPELQGPSTQSLNVEDIVNAASTKLPLQSV